MNLKSAVRLAIAVSVLGAAPALATSIVPPSSGPAPAPSASTGSGLMVQVWDPSTDKGFVEWLGNTYQSFLPGGSDGATTPGTLLDFGTLDAGGWSAFVAAAGTDTIDWNVVAVNSTTVLATGPAVTTSWTTGNITTSGANNIIARLTNELGSTGTLYAGTNPPPLGGNCNPCNSDGSATNPAFLYLSSAGGGSMGATGTTGTYNSSGNSTLYMYQETTAGTSKQAPVFTQYHSGTTYGTWTLSSTGDLQYSFGSAAVPLPAAGWLLVSGLMGLVGLGRRRVQPA